MDATKRYGSFTNSPLKAGEREYHVRHILGNIIHDMTFHGTKTLDEIAQAFADEYEKTSGDIHAIRLDKKKVKVDQKPDTIFIISVDPKRLQ